MSTLYYNGTILTMKGEGNYAEALLEEGGKIVSVGTLAEVEVLVKEGTVRKDLNGNVLMPSFIDAHGHISMTAQYCTACNLSDCNTHEEIVAELIAYKEKNKVTKEGFILGYAYDHNFLPNYAHPTKEYLNQVSTEIPIAIFHTSGHMGCVNDVLLSALDITEDSEDPVGGVIGRVEGSQEPSGYLEENAMFVIVKAMGNKIPFDLFKNMQEAQMQYVSNGITTVQDGATSKETMAMLKAAACQNALIIDVVSYPMVSPDGKTLVHADETCLNKYNNHFKIGGYKVVLDGSPQGKSAWLSKPYENSGDYCAYSWFSDSEVEEFMKVAIDDNQQVLVHCNGDAAGDQFLNAYRAAIAKSSNPNKMNLRPVMIHCQTARADQLDIMAEYKVIPSIFVGHVYYWGDVHMRNLGKERGENVSPVGWAYDRGLVVNFHQDTPVTKPIPLHSVWAAVNRVTRNGVVIGANQKCSVYDALKAITINGAYSYFEENSKGSLEIGKLADMVILDKNPMTIDPMTIKDVKVLETIKEGTILYQKN